MLDWISRFRRIKKQRKMEIVWKMCLPATEKIAKSSVKPKEIDISRNLVSLLHLQPSLKASSFRLLVYLLQGNWKLVGMSTKMSKHV